MPKHISIAELQGKGLESDYVDQTVTIRGIVTCVLHRGFYLQSPNTEWDGQRSNAVFVYTRDVAPSLGSALEVSGEVANYVAHESAKPVTQVILDTQRSYAFDSSEGSAVIEPLEFDREVLAEQGAALATWLNAAEGMLVRIPAGSTFISPSNRYGDYVVHLPDLHQGLQKHPSGGLVLGAAGEKTWFPGFRVLDYAHAQTIDVGSVLDSDVIGALHHRVNSYQVSVNFPFKVAPQYLQADVSQLSSDSEKFRVMTLNCFNLDPHVEDANKVSNPRTDIDDDYGDGRFLALAKAIVLNAKQPDIVALQEIQDSDGAEDTGNTDASGTYALLIESIAKLCDAEYAWVDIPPQLNADGGQPGGNIRNGFIYRTDRVELQSDSLRRLGEMAAVSADANAEADAYTYAYTDSRKPLLAKFVLKSNGRALTLINLHLASKRHQQGAFSPDRSGFDPKQSVRQAQAQIILDEMVALDERQQDYYVTGDFNDSELSPSLQLLESLGARNLVMTLPVNQRFEYNHRGKLQLLMHGVASQSLVDESKPQFEILHGNELIGVAPGENSDRASDHAYLLALL